MKKLLSVLCLLFFLGCSLFCPPNPKINNASYIVDGLGRIMILHGLNVSNFSKTSPNNLPWHSERDYAKMSEWGFNVVRYLVFWSAIEPHQNVFNYDYLNQTKKQIEMIGKYGIQVIIDVHQDLYNTKFGGNGFPDWTVRDNNIEFGGPKEPWNLAYLDPAVISSYNNFWHNDTLKNKYLALLDTLFAFADTMEEVLGIDVMNEPFVSLSVAFECKDLTSLYYRVYNMVKNKGYTKLIFFEPWMSTSSGIPSRLRFLPKKGITVYSPHYYDLAIENKYPYTFLNKSLMTRALDIKLNEAIESNSALMFGEFGTPYEQYVPFIKDLLNEFDKRNASWVWWSYDKYFSNDYGVLTDSGQPRFMLNELIRMYPQKIAGRNPTWELTDDTLKLIYKNIGIVNPTVIFIPKHKRVIQMIGSGSFRNYSQYVFYWNGPEEWQSIKIVLGPMVY